MYPGFEWPIAPMLAKTATSIPPHMLYEPKWDGFRALISWSDGTVHIQSRSGRDLTVYFPELEEAFAGQLGEPCVVDGEIVVIHEGRLDFTRLSGRIHPSATRIASLSSTHAASFVAFDVLARGSQILVDEPLTSRRQHLHALSDSWTAPLFVGPHTDDESVAQMWFHTFEGAGLDGVMAKDPHSPYSPGVRSMVKIKHKREADVVVAGWREHKTSTSSTPLLGSLQLGLYDEEGEFHWVGVAASFTGEVRAKMASMLAEITIDPTSAAYAEHPWSPAAVTDSVARRPGSQHRWAKELREVHLLDPLLVAEVGYEHLEGTRFRNTTRFRRWRPDKPATACTFADLEVVARYDFGELFSQ